MILSRFARPALIALSLWLPQAAGAEVVAGEDPGQTVPTRIEAAEALVAQAIAEHRRFQTCLSLLPRDLDGSAQIWTRMAAEAAQVLASEPGTEALVATLEASALEGALLPAPETPFAEVRALCVDDPDWHRRMMLFDFLQLPAALDHLFQD